MNNNFLLLKKKIKRNYNRYKVKNNTKYFCIGKNKTGTTSIAQAFSDLGFVVAEQDVAENLYDTFYFSRDFSPILKYCKCAEVFQDVPFIHFDMIKAIDLAFSNSKFILTIRDSDEQWYNSFSKYYSRFLGVENGLADYADIIENRYVSSTFFEQFFMKGYGVSKENPFDREVLKNQYNLHNSQVMDYFSDKPDKLLVINVSEKDSFKKFLRFVGKESHQTQFPWKNKT